MVAPVAPAASSTPRQPLIAPPVWLVMTLPAPTRAMPRPSVAEVAVMLPALVMLTPPDRLMTPSRRPVMLPLLLRVWLKPLLLKTTPESALISPALVTLMAPPMA